MAFGHVRARLYRSPIESLVLTDENSYVGFRDLGFGLLLSLLSMFVIHGGFS